MGDKTGISWSESTWNPIVGCSKVSPGCANCYAETLAARWGWTPKPWLPEFADENVTLKPERLDQPIRWKRPRKIFVNSLSDVFHENVPFEFIDKMFAVMALAPQHTYQVLTKRPERMREYMSEKHFVSESLDINARQRDVLFAAQQLVNELKLKKNEVSIQWPLPNVWLGTSVENARWRTRIDDLRETPAAVRFLSCEPLLGSLTDWTKAEVTPKELGRVFFDLTGIDWVIIGGESGPGARPMEEQWVRDIVAECKRQRVAVWVKQFGEVWSRKNLGHGGHAANIEEFPEDLRIQKFPKAERDAAEQGAFAF